MKMIIVFYVFSFRLFAGQADVATVVSLKGNVQAQFTKGEVIDLKLNQALPEGTKIKTSSKSFVRMMFNDKSEISLGPNSLMAIISYPKNDPGIISLLRGEIRSQVTKDYGQIEDTANSKLYIKTESAALGVRGTDFQVNYNLENQNTSLITFEGKVAMTYIEESDRHSNFNQEHLQRILKSNKTVMVERGHISAINHNIAPRPMIPTILDATQINILARKNIDPDKLPSIADHPVIATEPNGFYHELSGEYKLPAGSIIDLNTVNIIPPPKNALLDAKSNTFKVPSTHGRIDPQSGNYQPPVGLKLAPNGKFVPNNNPVKGSGSVIPKLYEYKSEMNKTMRQTSPHDPSINTPKDMSKNLSPRRQGTARMPGPTAKPNIPPQLPRPLPRPLPKIPPVINRLAPK